MNENTNENAHETLMSSIARTVTFSNGNGHVRSFDAGTRVYVERIRNGVARVRVCGTRYTQDVYMSSLNHDA